MSETDPVFAWLLDSDPAIRWQVMRDLLDVPESEWWPERAKVETEGWGALLLSHQDDDGQWDGGACFPGGFDFSTMRDVGQPWTSTLPSLNSLRGYGLDPDSVSARRTVELVGRNSKWEHDNQPYWEGEVEECINGRVVADGAYFGVDVSGIVDRLLSERLEDGGWNCQRANGSVRSSFDATINVLEGLLEYERANGATPETREARRTGEEYLLKRHLYQRLSTGEPAADRYLSLRNPIRWHYQVLRGLDYFRSAGIQDGSPPDPRLGDAISFTRSRRRDDGKWPVDRIPPGKTWFQEDDGEGEPSRWVSLWALRVLRWWDR